MSGYDALESYRPHTEAEKLGTLRVTQFLRDLLEKTIPQLSVRTYREPDIYGRYSAELFVGTNSINEAVKSFIDRNHLAKEELRK